MVTVLVAHVLREVSPEKRSRLTAKLPQGALCERERAAVFRREVVLEVSHRSLPATAFLAIGAVDVEEEDSLGEAEVHVVGAVGTEAGRALVALGQDPFRDAGLAEEAAAAGDTMGVVGNKLERER